VQRSAVASDILAKIEACLGDECRDYVFARTRGIPPADCNSITTSWVDRSIDKFTDCESPNPDICRAEWDAIHGLRVTLTRICAGPDAQPVFDWAREDGEAACFDDLVDLVEECVQCQDWQQFITDHSIYGVRYDSTTYDVEAEGGAFSAYIELTIQAAECCPAP
jgi:hypothetical protein